MPSRRSHGEAEAEALDRRRGDLIETSEQSPASHPPSLPLALKLDFGPSLAHGKWIPDLYDWVLDVGQLGCVLAAASKGLGQIDGSTRAAKVGSLTMASEAILILGLALAKCSVLFLVRRIASTRSILCDTLLGLSLLWGLASILLVTIDCSPTHIIGVDGFCEHQLIRWAMITVFDSIIEIGIFIQAVALVRPLQMKLQRKVSIALVFSLRLPPTVAVATTIILQQVELSYSLMASSFAILSTFLKKFNSGMGLSLGSATGTHRGDYELSYLKKRSIPETSDTERLRLTTGNGRYTSTVSHSYPKSKSPSLGEGSQPMEIRRDFHVHVSYEDVRHPAYQADISRL
ncbi:MAG: hypothetical protein Q9181_003098 [Wetmoreana brouardii]